jgi:DNA-binding transcriptional MerR regulator
MIRLYFDEDSARRSLITQLRTRGADVVAAQDVGMEERTDEEQLIWAVSNSRALYSFNRGDFCRLHKAWLTEARPHAGIILSRQDLSIGEQMRRLLRLINKRTPDEMRNRIEFLSAWS